MIAYHIELMQCFSKWCRGDVVEFGPRNIFSDSFLSSSASMIFGSVDIQIIF